MPDFHPVYFGVDVEAVMRDYFNDIFVPARKYIYGDKPFALVVLSNRVQHDWTNPLAGTSVLLRFAYGDEEKVNAEDGLFANVAHKLQFVLRTGLPSSEATNRPELLEPGDFPYAGAGMSSGFIGGVSGFTQEQDWEAFCDCAEVLAKVRAAAAQAAVAESQDRVCGMKYLGGTPAQPGIYIPE